MPSVDAHPESIRAREEERESHRCARHAPAGQTTNSGYNYDAAGNLLSETTHRYHYDAENRITCVNTDVNWNCTPNSIFYLYDPQGQRAGWRRACILGSASCP